MTQTFPGYNWTPEGQAIWQNGCSTGMDPLTPIVKCVEVGADGGFLAHFGYDNPNSTSVVSPFENAFSPTRRTGAADRRSSLVRWTTRSRSHHWAGRR